MMLAGGGVLWLVWPQPSARVDAGVPLVAAAQSETVADPPSPVTTQLAPPMAVPVRLVIPDAGIDAPIVPITDPGGVLEPPPDIATVGWWQGQPRAGRARTVVLVGHVDGRCPSADPSYCTEHGLARGVPIEGALFPIGRAEVGLGATAALRLADGTAQSYHLVSRQEIAKKAFVSMAPSIFTAAAHLSRLAVITCGGAFDSSSGQYLANEVDLFEPGRG